jgi:urease accessory protein
VTHEANVTASRATDAGGDPRLRLLVWLSPAFPVGAFAYSHGLEAAIESGDAADRATTAAWIDDLLRHGAGRNDAILLAAAWRAVAATDEATLAQVNELALALSPSRERLLETSAQGSAFVAAIEAAWPSSDMRFPRDRDGAIAYCVALGVAARAHGVPLVATLEAYLVAFVANLVSAATRLGSIGQTDAQRVIAALTAAISEAAAFAAGASLDDLGGAAMRADIASMRHETQYSRLFRS